MTKSSKKFFTTALAIVSIAGVICKWYSIHHKVKQET